MQHIGSIAIMAVKVGIALLNQYPDNFHISVVTSEVQGCESLICGLVSPSFEHAFTLLIRFVQKTKLLRVSVNQIEARRVVLKRTKRQQRIPTRLSHLKQIYCLVLLQVSAKTPVVVVCY